MSYPSLVDFQNFVVGIMGIPLSYLPADAFSGQPPLILGQGDLSGPPVLGQGSTVTSYVLNTAINFTNPVLQHTYASQGSWSPYYQAVLNLAGHLLIESTPDQTYPIRTASWSAGVVTVTLAGNNQIQVGDNLVITGISPLTYDTLPGETTTCYAILNSTQFQYLLAPNPGPVLNVSATAAATEQYFASARREFKITGFTSGVVASASDLTTSSGLLNPKAFEGMTLMDLNLLTTPYGRAYLSIVQAYGPSVWGLT